MRLINKMKTKLFYTEDGMRSFPTRLNGKNETPMGCYYDEGEVADALKRMLDLDIFPFIDSLERRLLKSLSIQKDALHTTTWVGYEPGFDNASIRDIQQRCERWLDYNSYYDFQFYMNIEVTAWAQSVGTQVNIYHDKLKVLNLEETEEFPVHFIGITRIGKEPQKANLDERFTGTQLDYVFNWILEDLNKSIL